eukprot:RCo024498
MGKSKKKRTKEVTPWCFYCDKEFQNEKVLIDHQKAKHFKCPHCMKKLPSTGGLSAHVLQVHKETIKKVPNAKEGRDDIELDVYGMDGIPEEFLDDDEKDQKRRKENEATPAAAAAAALSLMPMGLPFGVSSLPLSVIAPGVVSPALMHGLQMLPRGPIIPLGMPLASAGWRASASPPPES